MGDRVVVQVVDDREIAGAALYLHWGGQEIIEELRAAVPLMRKDDSSYSAARLIGHACAQRPNQNTGVGVLPACSTPPVEDDSHGDAGVIVYDCSSGVARAYGGYLADDGEERKEGRQYQIGIPPD